MSIVFPPPVDAGASRFRKPAPLEDDGPLIEEPTFGRCAGHENSDGYFHVMEWVAKRTWHILGLAYERKDFTGPPSMSVKIGDQGVEIGETVACAGVPLRNQVITCEIMQRDDPVLIVLRSTDAFGEVLIELDLLTGSVRARSVTVSRSMIGGQSHSSPMPEESSNRIIEEGRFEPVVASRPVKLKIRAQGERIVLWVDTKEIFHCQDPDPAGGKFGFGSTGTILVRNVEQWELISPEEKQRREQCLEEMHEFCKALDAGYDQDVRKCNQVQVSDDEVVWTWPPTGATAKFAADRGRVLGTVKAGLYGDDTLVDGVFPEIVVIVEDGAVFGHDADGELEISADELGVRMRIPLRDGAGNSAIANVLAEFSVQTVWFWTVTVEGVQPKYIQAFLGLAPQFALKVDGSAQSTKIPNIADDSPKPRKAYMKHNAKAGIYVKAIEPENSVIGGRVGGKNELAISTTDPKLRFATVILPAQPLNKIGFSKRMVHYIKYPEGPVQHWRRRPSFQEYPTNVDLARFKGHGTDAMVWHHTWVSSDFRDREGFLVNEAEMKRAMDETHRLGMNMIGYIGIVPGRNSLLRIEDTIPLGGGDRFGIYDKNWDLQDFTFYHVAGRMQEFMPWMTDYWCREYGIDGFYLDGGLACYGSGALKKPLFPEDAELSIDELLHRLYYRVRKVLERHNAGFGLEVWGGLNWMLMGFHDCVMIGESFQEADPESYRDANNALLTGCCIKMYGMRETSQNPYNIAMAAVCMSDIQVCSGNGAWGDVADTMETWARVRPYWDIIKTVDWDNLIDARPWYAQELVSGEGFFAGNYTMPDRVLVFLANRTEDPGTFRVRIDTSRLPEIDREWHVRYVLGRDGDHGPLGDGELTIELPALHDGPIGLELVAVP